MRMVVPGGGGDCTGWPIRSVGVGCSVPAPNVALAVLEGARVGVALAGVPGPGVAVGDLAAVAVAGPG
jgi:hypothetical protein